MNDSKTPTNPTFSKNLKMPELFQDEDDFHFPVPFVEEEDEETTDTELKQTLYVKPQRRQFTDKLFIFLYFICFITMIIIGIILVSEKTVSLSVAKSLFLPLWNSAGKFSYVRLF
jgi:hypothetical protein